MKKSSAEKTRTVFLIVLSVIAVAGYFGLELYQGLRYDWEELNQKIRSAELELTAKTQALTEKTDFIADQQSVLDSFRQADSDEVVRSRMLSALQKLSSEQQIRISDMKPSSIREEKSYREFPVAVMLEGKFIDMMRFFYYAESADYGFKIREFRFSRSYGKHSDLKCQAVLSRWFLSSDI